MRVAVEEERRLHRSELDVWRKVFHVLDVKVSNLRSASKEENFSSRYCENTVQNPYNRRLKDGLTEPAAEF